jgi:ABC-2 type transport system ATP-binding protein
VDLRKSYRLGHLRPRLRPVLQSVSLSVPRGEVFGFLGANGAGKTTTLKILLGLMFPDGGSARILGAPLADRSWRGRVGYLPEHPYFYDYLTASEYLEYAGALFGLDPAERRRRSGELLQRLGLTGADKVPLRRYSKGMLQRLGIAQALINDPELVFLDEPMSGLDPIGRRLVRDVILDLKAKGKTVFFSTHILPDAEVLCDRVGLLEGGKLVNQGPLSQILKMDVSHVEVLVSGLASADVVPSAGVRQVRALGERWRLEVTEEAVIPVLQAVAAAGGRILSVQPIRQSLEDYFFKEVAATPGDRWAPRD